jgi:hypothetical protein
MATNTPVYTVNSAGAPIGVDKLHGRHVTYMKITIDGKERRFFAYSRISHTGSIDLRENTNPGSSVKGYQMGREEPPTFEVEVYIPYEATQAKDSINFLRAGRRMDPNGFDVQGLFEADYLNGFGSYIIERSSIDISRDDLTTVRATIRAMGYVCSQNVLPAPVFGWPDDTTDNTTSPDLDRVMADV